MNRSTGVWVISTTDSLTGKVEEIKAKSFVNASGPWVDEVLKESFKVKDSKNVRLIRGSHIVVNKLYDHDKSYICQNKDGRIFFIIPLMSLYVHVFLYTFMYFCLLHGFCL